jgi:hypothetical protein
MTTCVLGGFQKKIEIVALWGVARRRAVQDGKVGFVLSKLR